MILYIFLDEGGNLDFSPNGTHYFTLTALSKTRPFNAYKELNELKYDILEKGIDLDSFHASEDKQLTRNSVFDIIAQNLPETRIDSLILDKKKIHPLIRREMRFYPEMLGYLLKYITNGLDESYKEILIFTDTLPLNKQRKAVEKTIKTTLSHILPRHIPYKIFHHSSKSNYDLQIVDYCNWALFRKWERKDERSYRKIETFIKSEFEIFKSEEIEYY